MVGHNPELMLSTILSRALKIYRRLEVKEAARALRPERGRAHHYGGR